MEISKRLNIYQRPDLALYNRKKLSTGTGPGCSVLMKVLYSGPDMPQKSFRFSCFDLVDDISRRLRNLPSVQRRSHAAAFIARPYLGHRLRRGISSPFAGSGCPSAWRSQRFPLGSRYISKGKLRPRMILCRCL